MSAAVAKKSAGGVPKAAKKAPAKAVEESNVPEKAVKSTPRKVVKEKNTSESANVNKNIDANTAEVAQEPTLDSVETVAATGGDAVVVDNMTGGKTSETEVPIASMAELLDGLLTQFQTLERMAKSGKQAVKKANQMYNKSMKQMSQALKSKSGRKKREKDPDAKKRAPSGFAKPGKISSELSAFLQVDPDVEMARTEAVKLIGRYIKANSLENPANKREIFLDDALSALLNVPKDSGEEVTYFTLQKHLAHHFPKKAVVATV